MRASSLRRSTRLTSSAICSGLGGGVRNSRLNTCRSCATVNAGVFFSQPPPLQRQEPQGQQRQRHVVVPAHPTPHLVVRQADLPLGLPDPLLPPAAPGLPARHHPPPPSPPPLAHRPPPLPPPPHLPP